MGDAPYAMHRLPFVVRPAPDDPHEALGVLNPASARGPDGELYLFPRVVAAGNYSRIGCMRVRFDDAGEPVDAERLGLALEPAEAWEVNGDTAGVEDPRITYLDDLGIYVMTYTAYGPLGPRIALAASPDLERWERLGPAWFTYEPKLATDLNLYPNKDAVLFPEPVPAPDGRLAYALLHRPMWDLSLVNPQAGSPLPAGLDEPRPGIWISFAPLAEVVGDPRRLVRFQDHRLVALPERDWEAEKIGGGTPPVRTAAGWLSVFHGVTLTGPAAARGVYYSAGVLVLDADDPTRVLYRSTEPLLKPETPDEREGTVNDVVFPTALDVRSPKRIDVYYGMADARIGAARLSISPDRGPAS